MKPWGGRLDADQSNRSIRKNSSHCNEVFRKLFDNLGLPLEEELRRSHSIPALLNLCRVATLQPSTEQARWPLLTLSR
jgi:hypothetical protein